MVASSPAGLAVVRGSSSGLAHIPLKPITLVTVTSLADHARSGKPESPAPRPAAPPHSAGVGDFGDRDGSGRLEGKHLTNPDPVRGSLGRDPVVVGARD